VNSADIKL